MITSALLVLVPHCKLRQLRLLRGHPASGPRFLFYLQWWSQLWYFVGSYISSARKQTQWWISSAFCRYFVTVKSPTSAPRVLRFPKASCGRPVVAGPECAKPCALRRLSEAVGWSKPCRDGWDRRACWGHLGRWLRPHMGTTLPIGVICVCVYIYILLYIIV